MKTRKNPHAVALGRLGGLVKSPKKAAAVRRNGRLGGRPQRWRLHTGVLQELSETGRWRSVVRPYTSAARQALMRLRQEN